MASKKGVQCFLRCFSSSHPDIVLPDGVEVTVGRGPTTKVKEARCSREQVRLVADTVRYKVKVTQLGVNSSSVDGEVVGTGETRETGHSGTVDLLSGQYRHTVIFNPPPGDEIRQNVNTDRQTQKHKSDEPEEEQPRQRQKRGSRPWFKSGPGELLSESDDGVEWREVDGGLVARVDTKISGGKVAAFDIDGTIITTMSGKVFPTDIHDWKILYSEVPGKLKKLAEDKFKIVFITNQAGIRKGKMSVKEFQTKIDRILDRLGVTVSFVLISTADKGYFRKPRTGLWEWLEEKWNVDRDNSFYCGDAAGREVGWQTGKKKDFSCSDRLLAANLGVKFYTPEEFFLGQVATRKFSLPGFIPNSVSHLSQLLYPADTQLVPRTPTLTLMVGIQGSGKSGVARLMEKEGCLIASNDLSGGKEKTLRLVQEGLSSGRSVVVDNTHVDKDARRPYIVMAQKFGVPVRAFLMSTSHDHARHNNIYRELTDPSHARIKEPLINQYRSRHVPPQLEEGIKEIVKVNFVPNFLNDEERRLYFMHLLEK